MGISVRLAFGLGGFSDSELVALRADMLIDPVAWKARYRVAGYRLSEPVHCAELPLSALILSPQGRSLTPLSPAPIAVPPTVTLDRGMTRNDETTVHERFHWTPCWANESDEPTEIGLLGALRLFEARVEYRAGFTERIVGLIVDFFDGQLEQPAMPSHAQTVLVPPQRVACIESFSPDFRGIRTQVIGSRTAHGEAPWAITPSSLREREE